VRGQQAVADDRVLASGGVGHDGGQGAVAGGAAVFEPAGDVVGPGGVEDQDGRAGEEIQNVALDEGHPQARIRNFGKG
jgi:hypothetical protein